MISACCKSSFQMTAERNYAIAIATLGDWVKIFALFFQSMWSKTNHILYTPFSPASRKLQAIGGSSCCFFLFWLVGVIALVLVHLEIALVLKWFCMEYQGIINFAFPLSCAKQTFSQDSLLTDLPLQQGPHWLLRSCSAGVELSCDSVSLESYFYSIQCNSLTFKIMVGFIGTQRSKCHLQEQDSSTCSSTSRDPSQQ